MKPSGRSSPTLSFGGNQGSERLRDLPKVTQLPSGSDGVCAEPQSHVLSLHYTAWRGRKILPSQRTPRGRDALPSGAGELQWRLLTICQGPPCPGPTPCGSEKGGAGLRSVPCLYGLRDSPSLVGPLQSHIHLGHLPTEGSSLVITNLRDSQICILHSAQISCEP